VLTSVLNKVRNNAIKLSDDYLSTRSETLWADVNHLCLKKGPNGKQVVFCINNRSSNGGSYEVSVGGFQSGEKVVEVLGCKANTADAMGNVTMYMGKGEPKVYVPELALAGTGLCGQTEEDAAISGAAALGLTGSILMAAVIGWATVILA
jgi:alpha-amylase